MIMVKISVKIEESKVSSGNRLHEAVIAGANGLVYSSDRNNTAKENAADNLLRKLGKLPNGQVSKMTESEDNSEIDRFYNTFYELLNKYPEGDDFWREVAEASMGIDFLNEWKKVHPDTTISEEDATKMFQNFIDDRFDI